MANIVFMKSLLACTLLLFAALAPVLRAAEEKVYNETADAKAEIKQALTKAGSEHKSVLVVFGANWCPDCRVLDAAFKQPGPTAELVAKEFEVVKVDLGRYDHNVEVAESYGVDIKKGIPTIAVLSAKGDVLQTTNDHQLSDARHMGDDGIHQFFKKVVADHPAKS